MSLGQLFKFPSHKPSEEEVSARIDGNLAAALPALAAQGWDTKMIVYDAISSTPTFSAPFVPIPGVTKIGYHDLGHVVCNALSGKDENDFLTGRKFEQMADLATEILEAPQSLKGNAGTKLREKLLRGIERGIQKQLKYGTTTSWEYTPANKLSALLHFRKASSPQLTPENYSDYERAIDKAMKARDFFVDLAHEQPIALGWERILKLPLSYFGLYAVPREDGKTARFEFYPEEQRLAVIETIQDKLTAKEQQLIFVHGA